MSFTSCTTANETRVRYQWLWTIKELVEGDCGTTEKVPMQVGDRLFVFFVSENEVCFHRRGKSGFANDRVWEETRGLFNPKTGHITGEIMDEQGSRTMFTIKLSINDKTGEGRIEGKHTYNPDAGGWIGNDD